MKLLIVESPSKAKTIEKYLDGEYTVRASIGHVRDLPKSNKQAIDIEAGFVPTYEISPRKDAVVAEIKKLAKKASQVLLATDPDREGEAIAWHIQEACDLKGAERVTFNEITKEAVLEAIKHPRAIDMNLKEAQEARRVLDRLVGYDLSGLIWKKVRYGLSAGRVQSPALRIIMEREREIRAFIPEIFFVLDGDFEATAAKKIQLTLTCDEEPKTKDEVERILSVGNKNDWHVVEVSQSEAKRSPKAPFTTSTLQQAASSRLGFSPSRTMGVAQKLYERGFITYMRTDSTNMSAQAVAEITTVITKQFGKDYLEVRQYKTKSKNAQEAHEAIRPTHASIGHAGATDDEKELYGLIWGRTLASQMSDAKVLRTKISANVVGSKETIPNFSVNGSITLFPGWLLADPDGKGEDVELPALKEQDGLKVLDLRSLQKQTEPPSRYTEAGLVKELEKRGIGRPSTYASIISTIEERGYVEKQGKTLFPTDTGDVVSSFLEEHFGKYISDSFTAEMEDELDEIANGTRTYRKTLEEFYTPFLKDVKEKDKSAGKATDLGKADASIRCPICGSDMVIKLGKGGKFLSCSRYPDCTGALTLDGQEVGEEKPFAFHPKTGEAIYLLTGRFGPYVQLGKSPKKEPKVKGKKKKVAEEVVAPIVPAPKRASLPPRFKPEDLTAEMAVKLLELPRDLGADPKTGEPIIANNGRFGPYVGRNREFRSIKKPLDAYTITLEQAVTLLNTQKVLPKGATLVRTVGIHPKTKREIQILNSKSGYFVKQGLQRIYIPDSMNVETITLDEVIDIINSASTRGKR
jgi:DNA topoisomerase-1